MPDVVATSKAGTTRFVKVPAFAQNAAPKSPPPIPHSEKNPTIGGLYSATDRSKWVEHRVPKITSPGNVMFEPIYLNRQKYEPGTSYTVPPEVDAELNLAEQRYRDSITKQITGNDMNAPALTGELEAQRAFELRRKAREAAGVIEAVA